MRVSLLLQREPFGELLERTLAPYWSAEAGRPVNVRWAKPDAGDQVWQGNIYLNFFCVADADPRCFDVIVREFGFARSAWRRGLQSAYVRAAVTAPSRSWLSQVCFGVSPAVPAAADKLVIGGNRRLRIIEPGRSRSTVIHKAGYSRLAFDREIAARRGPAYAVAPGFLGIEFGGMSFVEEYFAGTPANRLSAAREADVRAQARAMLVELVHRPTLRVSTGSEQLDAALVRLTAIAPTVATAACDLAAWAGALAGNSAVGVCFTHGDFQDANILVGASTRIIDWESSTDRPQVYDLATHASNLRLAADRWSAWKAEVTRWLHTGTIAPALLVPVKHAAELKLHAALWWLEEALFELEELQLSHSAESVSMIAQIADSVRRTHAFLRAN